MDWWQSQLELVYELEGMGGRENKTSKDECELFYNKI